MNNFAFLKLYGILSLIAILFITANAFSQDESNALANRGRHSYESFINDIEKIETRTGRLMLKIPLAGLPAGRGGQDYTIYYVYNSRLWDSRRQYTTTDNRGRSRGLADRQCLGDPFEIESWSEDVTIAYSLTICMGAGRWPIGGNWRYSLIGIRHVIPTFCVLARNHPV